MINAASILAVSDSGVYAMWGVQMAITTALGIVLWRLSQTTTRLDRSEDQRRADLKDLSDRLHNTTEKLIDERFRTMTHSLNGHVHNFNATLDLAAKRLAEAEKRITDLGGMGPQAELALVKQVGLLQQCMASKEELAEVRESIKEITSTLNKVERENLTRDDMRKLLQEFQK